MRTVAKKIVAMLIGLVGGWITAGLIGLGITPEQAAEAVSNLEAFLVIAVTGAIFFLGDYLLAKIKKLFPGDWAEAFWRDQAGDQVKPLTKTTAKTKISQGQI